MQYVRGASRVEILESAHLLGGARMTAKGVKFLPAYAVALGMRSVDLQQCLLEAPLGMSARLLGPFTEAVKADHPEFIQTLEERDRIIYSAQQSRSQPACADQLMQSWETPSPQPRQRGPLSELDERPLKFPRLYWPGGEAIGTC
mmetsp:Transcript_58701/g.136979  ORF Transcript_58701/g.136979 Transcript_58701/m.136979 type:complete len:145 (-) Transcript_58701:86-520(-)